MTGIYIFVIGHFQSAKLCRFNAFTPCPFKLRTGLGGVDEEGSKAICHILQPLVPFHRPLPPFLGAGVENEMVVWASNQTGSASLNNWKMAARNSVRGETWTLCTSHDHQTTAVYFTTTRSTKNTRPVAARSEALVFGYESWKVLRLTCAILRKALYADRVVLA